MIVKTGANYQNDGGYIEAGISNDIVTFKTGDIDLSVAVSSSNEYGAVVNGSIKLNGAIAPTIIPNMTKQSEGHIYPGSQYVQPDTKTARMWMTSIDMFVTSLTTVAGYTNPVLSSNSKNCSMVKSGSNYLISITGDDFMIDIVEGQ